MLKDVNIIGSGPAGYCAAVYCVRAGMTVRMIMGRTPGGQLTTTKEVENYPGFPSILGPELMDNMHKQVSLYEDIEIINEYVERVELIGDVKKSFTADTCLESKTVIIATGAQSKWLHIPGEDEYQGWGVSGCATCDGFFFRGKHVAVVGGGNSAVEDALFLSSLAAKVTLIHRGMKLRAEKILQQRLAKKENVEVIYGHITQAVLGKKDETSSQKDAKMVTSLELKNLGSDKVFNFEVDGLFVAIGHQPATSVFKEIIDLDEEGYIITHEDVLTNINGVFAAGDVHDKRYRQAITAAGYGCMASLAVQHYLTAKES